jgi:hypothetical protein
MTLFNLKKMKKEELWKMVDLETQWLAYYGLREDREVLDLSKNSIYEQLRSIGYTKRVIPLDLRCIGALCYEWKEGMCVENLVPLNERRNLEENKFTPTEIWVKLFPNEKELIYKKINNG